MNCPRCGLVNPPEALRCDCGWDFAAKAVQSSYVYPTARSEPRLASLQDRLVGKVIDGAIAFGMVLASQALSSLWNDSRSAIEGLGRLLSLSYFLFADCLGRGQSFGKRIAHTAVVDAVSQSPGTSAQCLARNLTLVVLHIIDWIFILVGDKRQRLGDRLAKTIVVTTQTVQAADVVGPALSAAETDRTQQVYVTLSTARLQELLASASELRPGAEALLRAELQKRGDQALS